MPPDSGHTCPREYPRKAHLLSKGENPRREVCWSLA